MSDINPEFLNNSLKIKKIAHFRGRDLYGCFFIIDTIFIPFYEDRGYEIALTHSELTGDDCIVLGRYKTLKEAEIHHRKYLNALIYLINNSFSYDDLKKEVLYLC